MMLGCHFPNLTTLIHVANLRRILTKRHRCRQRGDFCSPDLQPCFCPLNVLGASLLELSDVALRIHAYISRDCGSIPGYVEPGLHRLWLKQQYKLETIEEKTA